MAAPSSELETRRLDSMPALAPLYARALAASLPLPLIGGGEDMPDHALEVEGVEIDRDRLAAYCRVCGFGLREDAVPATYPHILGFPLSMALMCERSFPFPLVGLVHIANRIDERCPIAAGDRPTLRLWAENLRPHRRGRQLDLITEVSVGGDVAWREVSTYLRRGGGDDGAERAEAEAEADRGEVVAVWSVPGDIGRRYAEVSGDRNPIHLHGLAARPFGFPSAIAHGMWMKARCLAALEGRLEPALVASVEFRSPLRIPGRARLRLAERERGYAFAIEGPDGERTHLVGEAGAMG
jgi:acyl dehydratase